MPRSPKSQRTTRINQIRSTPRWMKIEEWHNDSQADDDAVEPELEETEDFENVFQKWMAQAEHTEWLNSKTSLVHETVQDGSKEMVKAGVFAIDEAKAAFRKFRAQETEYEKYYEDHKLTKQRQQDGFRQLHDCFSPILENWGHSRAYEVNATCELVKNNPSHRQEILWNFSKSMRSRFEEAKRKEKEIEDAEALIEMVKRIMYF